MLKRHHAGDGCELSAGKDQRLVSSPLHTDRNHQINRQKQAETWLLYRNFFGAPKKKKKKSGHFGILGCAVCPKPQAAFKNKTASILFKCCTCIDDRGGGDGVVVEVGRREKIQYQQVRRRRKRRSVALVISIPQKSDTRRNFPTSGQRGGGG